MEELREKGTEMEQDEEGPSMSSKEENIENLPFFDEAHPLLSLSFSLLVMDTYGLFPRVVEMNSRGEPKGFLSLSLCLPTKS